MAQVPTTKRDLDGPANPQAMLSELQGLLDRHATQSELQEWAHRQQSRLPRRSPQNTSPPVTAIPLPLVAGATPALACAPASSTRANASANAMSSADSGPLVVPPRSTSVPVASASATAAGPTSGSARVTTASASTASIGAALPPITGAVTPQRRAGVESMLGELFSRAGPNTELQRKKPTPRQPPLPLEASSGLDSVPPQTAKSPSVFTRRAMAINTMPSALPTLDHSSGSVPLTMTPTGPLNDGLIVTPPPGAPAVAPRGEVAAQHQNELPQVLHVGDIAAQMGGHSTHSTNTDSSSAGASSALFMYMQSGSPAHYDASRSGSSLAGGNDSRLSERLHGVARPGRSVLNVSAYLNAEENPLVNGALPAFGSDEGPQFARTVFNRRMPVYVPVEETKAALAALNVPAIDDIMKAVHEVDIVALCLKHGLHHMFAYISVNVLLRYGFVKRLGLNVKKLYAFLNTIATFFREGNPFHHPFHASDVVIAAHQWLAQPTAAPYLSDMEIFAFLFSAIVMRVGHCGADNDFLSQLHHPFANVFGYSAPQQGATMALVLALLDQPANHFLPPLVMRTTLMPELAHDVDSPWAEPNRDTEKAPGADQAGNKNTNGHAAGRPGSSDTLMESNPNWTTVTELEFLDMVSELVLASDERNHSDHVANMAHIATEHFLQHGCLCPERSPEAKKAMTSPCPQCCAYIEDKDVPQLLKAVLHFVDFCFLFRPYSIFVSGMCMHTAELYRQASYRSQLLSNISHAAAAADAQGADAAVAVAAAAVETRMSDDPNAPSARWRPAMTRTSILATLRSYRTRPNAAPSTTQTTAANSAQATASDEDELPEDADAFFGPLRGYGRDICLVALETLYYPNLDATGPYLPKAWVSTFFANHHQLLQDDPSPVEYDAAIERVFRLGHRKSALSAESAAAAEHGAFYKAARYEEVQACGLRVERSWSLESDVANVRRFFKEILSPLSPTYI